MKTIAISIPTDLTTKWQEITEILSDISNAESALIVQSGIPFLEIINSSSNKWIFLRCGEKLTSDPGFLIEQMVATNDSVEVRSGEGHPWRQTDIAKRGFASILGYPLHYPDGSVFGAIILLGNSSTEFTDKVKRLLVQFRNSIESDLSIIFYEELIQENDRLFREEIYSAKKQIIRVKREEHRLKNYLELMEKQNKSILDYVDSIIFMIDPVGNFKLVNKMACDVFEYSEEELFGQNFFSLLVDDQDLETATKAINEFINHPDAIVTEREVCIVTKSSYKKSLLLSANLLHNLKGELVSIILTGSDVTMKQSADRELILDEARLESLIRIFEMENAAPDELLNKALEFSIELTQSKIGYIMQYDEATKVFKLIAWSKEVIRECRIVDKPLYYKLDETGLWGESIRQRKPIITNDYSQESPYKKGYPNGHVAIERLLSAPVFDHDRIVATIGVGNKRTDYTESDLRQVQLLLNTTWKLYLKRVSENAFRENERVMNSLLDSSPIGIGIIENEKFTYVNTEFAKIYGYEKVASIVGLNLMDLTPEIVRDEVKTLYSNVLNSSNSERSIKIYGQKRNGTSFPIEVSYSVLMTGNSFRIIVFVQDISEREISTMLLKKSEEKYRALTAQLPLGIYQTGIDGKIIYVNPAIIDMLGYKDLSELMAVNAKEMYFEPRVREEYINQLYHLGVYYQTEHLMKRKDGTYIWVKDVSRVATDKFGEDFIEGIMENITERKDTEEALVAAKEKAEYLSKLKSNFLANISHELRTPLNGIIGFAELLKNDSPDETTAEYSDAIYQSGRRLRETLNLILDLSRLESDKMEIDWELTPLALIVREEIEGFSSQIKEKGLTLNTRFAENIGVKVDFKIATSIFSALMSNAVKFTISGGIEVRTGKTVKGDKLMSFLRVEDTGIGIPPEKTALIFEAFRQASEGISRSFEGAGLGLTVSQKYAELMGGFIEVESTVGKGTTFTLFLPFFDVPSDEDAGYADRLFEHAPPAEQPTEPQKIHLLVVEDEKFSQLLIRKLLSGFGTIDITSEGTAAVEMARNTMYEIIFMDINLGAGIDGIEATAQIRQIEGYKNTPIVALTAYATDADRREFLQKGCSHFLAKPFEKSELLSLVNSLLGIN